MYFDEWVEVRRGGKGLCVWGVVSIDKMRGCWIYLKWDSSLMVGSWRLSSLVSSLVIILLWSQGFVVVVYFVFGDFGISFVLSLYEI